MIIKAKWLMAKDRGANSAFTPISLSFLDIPPGICIAVCGRSY